MGKSLHLLGGSPSGVIPEAPFQHLPVRGLFEARSIRTHSFSSSPPSSPPAGVSSKMLDFFFLAQLELFKGEKMRLGPCFLENACRSTAALAFEVSPARCRAAALVIAVLALSAIFQGGQLFHVGLCSSATCLKDKNHFDVSGPRTYM